MCNQNNNNKDEKDLAAKIIECARMVHKELGNCFDKEIYIEALKIKLVEDFLSLESHIKIPIIYNKKENRQ